MYNFLLANHQQINHPKCSGSLQPDLLTLVDSGGRYLDNSFFPTLMIHKNCMKQINTVQGVCVHRSNRNSNELNICTPNPMEQSPI